MDLRSSGLLLFRFCKPVDSTCFNDELTKLQHQTAVDLWRGWADQAGEGIELSQVGGPHQNA